MHRVPSAIPELLTLKHQPGCVLEEKDKSSQVLEAQLY